MNKFEIIQLILDEIPSLMKQQKTADQEDRIKLQSQIDYSFHLVELIDNH